MTTPRISSHADPDNRWSRFERQSGLPHGYFDTRRTVGDVAVAIVIGLAVLAFVTGWIQ